MASGGMLGISVELFFPNWIPYEQLLTKQHILCAVLAAIYFAIWHYFEKRAEPSSFSLPGYLQGIVRWWLAFGISTYGFAKLLKTQFVVPPYTYDTPIGELTGFMLTWHYFGYSYTLAVIIGMLQIVGSVFLLFRRTVLLGLLILLPVMTNIVLINIFYSITTGALVYSLLFTTGLLYLFFLDWPQIRSAIANYQKSLYPVRSKGWLKYTVRCLPILLSFFGLYRLVKMDTSDKILYGTYQVEEFKRNGIVAKSDAWLTDKSVYSKVYFSSWGVCSFSPNPYRYSVNECAQGQYTFDEATGILKIGFYGSPDSAIYHVSDRSTWLMTLRGKWHSDSLELKLRRLR